MTIETAFQLIAAERLRQIEVKGYSADKDDQVAAEALELAAWSYRDSPAGSLDKPKQWPWESRLWKPKSRKENLQRAGALYQAAADAAERAENYELRNRLRDEVASCAILLNSVLSSEARHAQNPEV